MGRTSRRASRAKRSEQPPTSEAVQTFLEQFVEQGKLNRWAIPAMIRFVDEIPKTSVGKLDKKRIRSEI